MEDKAPAKSKIILTAVLCLIIGYVAGREHVKYEMRSALTAAAKTLQDGMKDAFAEAGVSRRSLSASSLDAPPRTEAVEPAPIGIELKEKGFRDSDYRSGIYQDSITFRLVFDNRTGKDVRAFEGVLRFKDLLGNSILASKLAINDSIKTNESMNWQGGIDYNQFMDDHRRLRSEPKENLDIEFAVTKVLFTDGTAQSF